jgi:hypothetical protein
VRHVLLGALLAASLGLAACENDPPTSASTLPTRPDFASATESGNSSLAANFNGTSIPAGRTIWFNAIVKLTGVPSAGTNLELNSSTVEFTANGQSIAVSVPNARITYSASATQATTAFDASTNTWQTTVPVGYSGNVFLAGAAYPVTTSLPGGIAPVEWTGTFSSPAVGLNAKWKWAAAVYTQFPATLGGVGAKPIDGSKQNPYPNADHAGTPENLKPYVTGGATGGGGSNWTGGYSGTASVSVAVTPPGPQELYVVQGGTFGNIYVYPKTASGDVARLRSIGGPTTGMSYAAQVARDPANGQLYVANSGGSVTLYADGATGDAAPLRNIQGPSTGLTVPSGIALDAGTGELYVVDNPFPWRVVVFAPGADGDATPVRTITGPSTGMVYPVGVLLDPANGEMYVASNGNSTVTVYSMSASGDVPALRTISGPNTGLSGPADLTFDSAGRLYVSNLGASTITVYAPGANGDAAPVRVIGGASTGLSSPFGLVIDAETGELHVANNGNGTVTVYDADANGDVPPLRTIGGPTTGLETPSGLTF